jgi:hypothetical protein
MNTLLDKLVLSRSDGSSRKSLHSALLTICISCRLHCDMCNGAPRYSLDTLPHSNLYNPEHIFEREIRASRQTLVPRWMQVLD